MEKGTHGPMLALVIHEKRGKKDAEYEQLYRKRKYTIIIK